MWENILRVLQGILELAFFSNGKSQNIKGRYSFLPKPDGREPFLLLHRIWINRFIYKYPSE